MSIATMGAADAARAWGISKTQVYAYLEDNHDEIGAKKVKTHGCIKKWVIPVSDGGPITIEQLRTFLQDYLKCKAGSLECIDDNLSREKFYHLKKLNYLIDIDHNKPSSVDNCRPTNAGYRFAFGELTSKSNNGKQMILLPAYSRILAAMGILADGWAVSEMITSITDAMSAFPS